ncbi:hypothetical protein PG5_16500 [Pseudomonas sp. G5(2012)]|nr:hypothetical protein PG5_16500 [Pseudomonas sp. G5(2012)]
MLIASAPFSFDSSTTLVARSLRPGTGCVMASLFLVESGHRLMAVERFISHGRFDRNC